MLRSTLGLEAPNLMHCSDCFGSFNHLEPRLYAFHPHGVILKRVQTINKVKKTYDQKLRC